MPIANAQVLGTIRDMLGGRENVVLRIGGRRMNYFGHVKRMLDNRFSYNAAS